MAPKPGTAASKATQPVPPSKQREPPEPPAPKLTPRTAFACFLVANTLAALYAPIQDCDEVFNYWEPTHYLNHRYGLQTWEYSPDYAIRSWAYTSIHAIVIKLGSLLPFVRTKVAEFYFLRLVLGLVCALCETRLYSTIARTFNSRVAIFFSLVMISSPGMYHASTAYLPSSFAMYTTMLGIAAFVDWETGLRTAKGIFWFALGSLLGWPFAGALILPFIVEEVWMAASSGTLLDGSKRLAIATSWSLIILMIQAVIDSFFYKTLAIVPLNIVLYNVFSSSSKGPNIYGVEPWHFYIRNLTLNFNVWFWLAMAALPLHLLQNIIIKKATPRLALLRGIVFLCPFYLWLAIFTLQPHKEERFMYPAYPALALNAATSFHILLANFGSTDPARLFGKIPAQLKLALVLSFILGALSLGVFRTVGVMTAYSAPLNVYQTLQREVSLRGGGNVCLGKEWYRFPSSYFLPDDSRVKFIKSEFSGLLPGEFNEAGLEFGLYPGTWLLPSGMNDENREDMSKYADFDHCNFLVDSRLPGIAPTTLEPDYISDTGHWERLVCKPFLDVSRTSFLGRLFWVPDWSFMPARLRRVWGEYCLLARKD